MTSYHLGRDFIEPIEIKDKHASVSHNHATITVDGDKWVLSDNDSTNGTYIEEDGVFRRVRNMTITPDTWIRLGEDGHRGYYFKARRLLKPNDYREDFAKLFEIYQEFENASKRLDSHRRFAKYSSPIMVICCTLLTFLPGIVDNGYAVRLMIAFPGIVAPFIQDALLLKLEKRVKRLALKLICPKCRRALSKDDILNREHLFCQAR